MIHAGHFARRPTPNEETNVVTVELCQSNSVGSRFRPARVIEYREVRREEADRLIATRMENGFFWREQPEDRTGN